MRCTLHCMPHIYKFSSNACVITSVEIGRKESQSYANEDFAMDLMILNRLSFPYQRQEQLSYNTLLIFSTCRVFRNKGLFACTRMGCRKPIKPVKRKSFS